MERDQPLDQTFENLKNTSRLQSLNYKFGKKIELTARLSEGTQESQLVVKRSAKIFKNLFFKNGVLELLAVLVQKL